MKRYYRGSVIKKEMNRVATILGGRGWPSEVQCEVCYKRIKAEDAIHQLGGSGFGHRSYWMCKSHKE